MKNKYLALFLLPLLLLLITIISTLHHCYCCCYCCCCCCCYCYCYYCCDHYCISSSAITTTTTTAGSPSGINGRLNMFLDPEVTSSIPVEENGKIWGPLCHGVSSNAHGQGLQVVLSKTTTMSKPNKKPILARTSSRMKRSMLLPSVLLEDSNS